MSNEILSVLKTKSIVNKFKTVVKFVFKQRLNFQPTTLRLRLLFVVEIIHTTRHSLCSVFWNEFFMQLRLLIIWTNGWLRILSTEVLLVIINKTDINRVKITFFNIIIIHRQFYSFEYFLLRFSIYIYIIIIIQSYFNDLQILKLFG